MTQSITGTIPVAFVKEFQKKARHIKGNRILPITEYLLLEYATDGMYLTKTSIQHFVQMRWPTELFNEPLRVLIDESELYDFVNNINGDTVTFTQTVTHKDEADLYMMKLQAGKTTAKHFVYPANDFPKMPVADNEDIKEFTQEMLDAISEAALFISQSDTRAFLLHVNMQDKGIYGTDANSIYRNRIASFDAFLNADAVSCLSGAAPLTSKVDYAHSTSHTIITVGNTVYAFQDSDGLKKHNLDSVIASGDAICTITLNPVELIQFCNMTISASPELPIGVMKKNDTEDGVIFSSENTDLLKDRQKEIQAIVKGELPSHVASDDSDNINGRIFKFQCAQMKRIASLFTDDITLNIYPSCIVVNEGTVTALTQRCL